MVLYILRKRLFPTFGPLEVGTTLEYSAINIIYNIILILSGYFLSAWTLGKCSLIDYQSVELKKEFKFEESVMLFCDEALFYYFGRERSIFVSKNKSSATVIVVLLMKQTWSLG